MNVIVPAILAQNRKDLTDKLSRYAGIAEEVQIDIVDGEFASPATWPYAEAGEWERLQTSGEELPQLASFRIEVDLMVKNPQHVGHWIEAGATRIMLHLESTPFIANVLKDMEEHYGHAKGFATDLLALGLAINIDTDLALLEPYVDRIDYVQFMGIANIGKQGQPFSQAVIPKIQAFHKKFPDMPVQVDGGVNRQTAPLLLNAGVTRLVIGSALLNAPDVRAEYDAFSELSVQHGWRA